VLVSREAVDQRQALDLTFTRRSPSSPDDADLQLMHAAVLGLLAADGRSRARVYLNTIEAPLGPDWGRTLPSFMVCY
jgi:hypothetical protein